MTLVATSFLSTVITKTEKSLWPIHVTEMMASTPGNRTPHPSGGRTPPPSYSEAVRQDLRRKSSYGTADWTSQAGEFRKPPLNCDSSRGISSLVI